MLLPRVLMLLVLSVGLLDARKQESALLAHLLLLHGPLHEHLIEGLCELAGLLRWGISWLQIAALFVHACDLHVNLRDLSANFEEVLDRVDRTADLPEVRDVELKCKSGVCRVFDRCCDRNFI